jgi:hypothetical protein
LNREVAHRTAPRHHQQGDDRHPRHDHGIAQPSRAPRAATSTTPRDSIEPPMVLNEHLRKPREEGPASAAHTSLLVTLRVCRVRRSRPANADRRAALAWRRPGSLVSRRCAMDARGGRHHHADLALRMVGATYVEARPG